MLCTGLTRRAGRARLAPDALGRGAADAFSRESLSSACRLPRLRADGDRLGGAVGPLCGIAVPPTLCAQAAARHQIPAADIAAAAEHRWQSPLAELMQAAGDRWPDVLDYLAQLGAVRP